MPTLHVLSGPLDDDARAELLFAGDLIVFRDVGPLRALVAVAEEMIGDAGGDVDALERRFRTDPEPRRLCAAALADVGVDVERTYWDWLHLRVQPAGGGKAGWDSGTLGAHRDTWSSNVLAQANWWGPLRPIGPDRTIAFHLAYWSRPVANTSAAWDLEAIRAGARDVPLVPEPAEPVDPSSELRIVVEPGDLLCFSGAHLHASVPNTSAETRFSFEVRTVGGDDLRAGRGAPNLDGEAPHTPFEWFRRIPDGAVLAP
jgi:hypothetical protein